MNKIKQLRKEREMTVTELSDKLNIPQSTLTNYENNKRRPKNEQTWKKIADFFGVSIAYVMGLSDDRLTLKEAVKLSKTIPNLKMTPENSSEIHEMINRVRNVLNLENSLSPKEKHEKNFIEEKLIIENTTTKDRVFIKKYMESTEKEKSEYRNFLSIYSILDEKNREKIQRFIESVEFDFLNLP